VIGTDTVSIAAVDTSTAAKMAISVFKRGHERGFVDNYRYLRCPISAGVRYIFLDCERSLSTFHSFMLYSIIFSVVGLIAVFFLLLLFSGRIVHPVSESYEKQKQFISDAGHELKTPLTIISADTELIEMENGSNEWLDDIQKQIDRLTSLTGDLIRLSKLDEGADSTKMIEFPISDVIAETIHSFFSIAKTQEKTITADIAGMLSFCGDEGSIRKLVSILLDNALKYSPTGSTVSITFEKHRRNLRLVVKNPGANMNEEQLSHIFERFYRTEESRGSGKSGYGIGLSIARAIVTAHKGKISAKIEDGNILAITVLLPSSQEGVVKFKKNDL
jgi:signal transduction histidine kinase